MRTVIEYEVSSGIEGSGWEDGNAYTSLEEAEAAFAEELRETDPHRYRIVRLERCEADYDEDGECLEVRTLETIKEARV